MAVRTVESALVILPPPNTYHQINAIRRVYDRAFPRWMPHINLIYPFVKETEFSKEQQKIAKHLSGVAPFTVSLTKDSFGYFTHGKSSTIWVRPVVSGSVTQDGSTAVPQVAPAVVQNPAKNKKPKKIFKTIKRKVKKVVPVEIDDGTPQVVAAPIVIGYPNPNPFNYPVTSGLEALYDATWNDDVIELKKNPGHEFGLDLLRYAVWGTEKSKNIYPEIGGVLKFQSVNKGPYSPDKFIGPNCVWETKKRIEYREVWEEVEETVEVEEEEEDDQENQDDGFIAVVKRKTGGRQRDSRAQSVSEADSDSSHSAVTSQAVLELQRKLYEMYPGDNRDGVKSDFNPHLTLGQCKTPLVANTIEKWKQQWTDITFEVTAVHLISRRGQCDDFAIRKTVPLNVFETETDI